ncbi:carbohydrate kinase [Microbacterium sp. NPDC064584]|uniref:carbohydrate kinase family protein n=1 Tax=Microbacterium sp. NPDC064584 TaxID=3155817 RepID=UPI00341B5715
MTSHNDDAVGASNNGILVIGEALIDIVVTADGSEPVEHVGGSPANVALALGRLGDRVSVLTAIADDDRGRRIADHLRASGVAMHPSSWSLDRTSTALARITADGSARYEFDVTWSLPSVPVVRDDIVHVGSIAAFVQPGADSVLTALQNTPEPTVISFDPNIRPALVGDRAAALAQVDAITALADIVKLSDEDAEWLYPGWGAEAVVDRLLETGARVVAVTMGGDGALIGSAHGKVTVPAPHVKVRDTVGAGDTFSAGLIDAVLHQPDLLQTPDADALTSLGRHAAAAAAITVQRPGADPPTREELDRALRAEGVRRCTTEGIGLFPY